MKNKQAYLVIAILSLAALYFYQDPQWNGNSRLNLTRAVVEEGRLSIDSYHLQKDWFTNDKAYANGHYYTDKGIGSSLLAVPPYFLLYKFASALGIVLTSTLVKHLLTAAVIGGAFVVNGLLLYLIARALAPTPWLALTAALAVSLGTMLWPFSAVYFGHVPAATFLTSAFYLLFSIRRAKGEGSTVKFFLAGLALGFAFVTDYVTALIILGLLFYTLYFIKSWTVHRIVVSAISGAMGALLPLAVLLGYNQIAFGAIFTSGYSHEALAGFQQGHASGLMGIGLPDIRVLYRITLDPRFGLFWQSPVLFLAFFGYWFALRNSKYRAEGLVSLYSVLSLLLMNAGFYMWWGGWTFGPRLIIPALPFFIIPLALLPERFKNVLAVLTAISAGQMMIPLAGSILIEIIFDRARNLFLIADKPFRGTSLIYNYCLPLIFKMFGNGEVAWNLGYALGIPYRLSLPALIAIEAVYLRLFHIQAGHADLPQVKS